MSAAYAEGSKLIISDVDVKVGSRTSKNLETGDTIDDEAQPGDIVEFRIEVENNFTNEEDLDIEDITVDATIEEIDDGDDLEEESSEFDLSPGRSKRITLRFQVPLEVEEDTFNVLINAVGEDENGTDHSVEMDLELEVNKETHLLQITRKSITPAEVACNRRNVQISATVLNLGNEDEEDVTFYVLNPDLELDVVDEVGDLEAEPFEDTSRFSATYTFNVPSDLEEGSYPITLRALYDNDRRKAEDTVTLTVNQCGTEEDDVIIEDVEESEEDVDVIMPPTPPAVVVQPTTIPPDTTVTSESFFKSNAFVIAIIIAEVIAVIVGIVLIISLFVRRD